MTTPSETRAGKLLETLRQRVEDRLTSLSVHGPEWALVTNDVNQYFREALAASEPVEAVGEVLSNYMIKDGMGTVAALHEPLPPGTKLYTHPAPEQPGKGEADGPVESLRKFQENVRSGSMVDLPEYGQPSEPAEGDALARQGKVMEELCDVAYAAYQDYYDGGNHGRALSHAVFAVVEALSAPPTDAVRVDDAMVRRFVEAANPVVYLLPPPDVIRAALTAALDPQVMR